MSKAPDMSKISTVIFDKECKIKYTSFNDTQDLSMTFVNIDKNALSTYMALYSYATTDEKSISTTDRIQNELKAKNVEQAPIITATLKNKRKLLLTKAGDIFFTMLIKDLLKYYELELLRKGMRWICNLMIIENDIRIDQFMGVLGEIQNLFNYYHLIDIDDTKENLFVYDLNRKSIVSCCDFNGLSNDVLADWVYYNFQILKDKKQRLMLGDMPKPEDGLQDNFIVNNLKLPFKFTYDVINEIVGTGNHNGSNLYSSLSEEGDDQLKTKENFLPNTHFLKATQVIKNNKVLVWSYESFVGILPCDDDELELSILQEQEERLIRIANDYLSRKFKEDNNCDFHYIIQSIESENTIMSNFILTADETEEDTIKKQKEAQSSSWLTPWRPSFWSPADGSMDSKHEKKPAGVVNNLSQKEYKKLVNHLLAITSREKLNINKNDTRSNPEERLIKLKDYNLVIYISSVSKKFIMVVKDFPLEKPVSSDRDLKELDPRLSNLHLLGLDAAKFISHKVK